MGVLSGGNRLILCPAQQFVCGDDHLSDFSSLLVDQLHPFKELFRVSQEKIEVEAACLIENRTRR